MAKIPTTERRFYNTQKKVNTLSAYAGALLPVARQAQEMVKEQQEIKMDSLSVDARMKMTEATNEWRLANQSNPNDPEALKSLQQQYDSILSEYRGQIDPMYRSQWDIAGNKLKGAFDVENQAWGFKQRQENTKRDIQSSAENFYKLAYSYGQGGDIAKALADFQVSYDKLLDYGSKNLGTEDAAYLLKNYEKNFAQSFLSGMTETNPNAALQLLKNEKIKDMLGADAYGMSDKIIRNAISKQKLQNKANQYYLQLNIDNQLSGMNDFEAIDYLENNKDKFSKKFYDAKMKQYLNNVGINDETRAETYTDLLLQVSAIDKNQKAENIINQSNTILENIEDAYAKKQLKLADRNRLINSLSKIQGKQLPALIDDKSGWFTPYDYNDAYDDFEKNIVNTGKISNAMLEYHKALVDNEEKGFKFDRKDRQQLVKTISKKYNIDSLNNKKEKQNGVIKAEDFFGE